MLAKRSRTERAFKRLSQLVQDDPTERSLNDLAVMAASPDAVQRLSALLVMRKQIDAGTPPADFFDKARGLIADADNHCRWQALIVVGESIESNPEAVWQVVREFGVSEDKDMRAGVATVLLEHLLQYHFDWCFPRLKEEIKGSGNSGLLLADTLSACHAFGPAQERWQEVEALVRRSRRKKRAS